MWWNSDLVLIVFKAHKQRSLLLCGVLWSQRCCFGSCNHEQEEDIRKGKTIWLKVKSGQCVAFVDVCPEELFPKIHHNLGHSFKLSLLSPCCQEVKVNWATSPSCQKKDTSSKYYVVNFRFCLSQSFFIVVSVSCLFLCFRSLPCVCGGSESWY